MQSLFGEFELLADLMGPFAICENPTFIECKKVGSSLFHDEIPSQKITCNAEIGLMCFHKDQPDNRCLDYEVRFFCSCPYQRSTPAIQPSPVFCPDGKWTDWMDINNPRTGYSGGDYELLGDIIEYTEMCLTPTDIECRIVGSALFYDETREQRKVTCDPEIGLLCFNKDQISKQCLDYEVRFFCPCRLKTDAPIQQTSESRKVTTVEIPIATTE
ncbi:mucin-5AC-like, partial [Saccoglossus kowalevskii]